MARAALLSLALLFVSACADDSVPSSRPARGASASRQASLTVPSLGSRLESHQCNATCNGGPFEGKCDGVMRGGCFFDHEGEEYKIKGINRFDCVGSFEFSKGDTSADVSCVGIFADRLMMKAESCPSCKKMLLFEGYACGNVFNHTSSSDESGHSEVTNCVGGQTIRAMEVISNGTETLEEMDELMDALSASMDDSGSDDAGNEVGVPLVSDAVQVTVTCNGEPAKATDQCKGEFVIEVVSEKVSANEQCTGHWMPSPLGHSAMCGGHWSVEETVTMDSGRTVEGAAECEPRVEVARGARIVRGHLVVGTSEMCEGKASMSRKVTPPPTSGEEGTDRPSA